MAKHEESLIIEPEGFADEHRGTISRVYAYGHDTTLLHVEFDDGREMLFPGNKQVGGKWKYAKGLAPNVEVHAAWRPNPVFSETDPKSGPRAFFTLEYLNV